MLQIQNPDVIFYKLHQDFLFSNYYLDKGISIKNVVPFPFSVLYFILPLKWALILEYDINIPRPVPFFPLVVTISLNIFSWTVGGNPPAKSSMAISKYFPLLGQIKINIFILFTIICLYCIRYNIIYNLN